MVLGEDKLGAVRRGVLASLSVALAVASLAGCGNSVEPDESVAGVLEHFCRYEAPTEEREQSCFQDGISNAEKMLHREEWGPRAQAVLYALGEIRDCLSKSGSQCESASWTVERKPSLIVERYCHYGSSSGAQVVGCIAHVRSAEIIAKASRQYEATNAARYAIGDRTDCGYDSGPFCG